MASRFVAPKRLTSLEEAQTAFQRIQEQLDALARPKRQELVTSATTLRADEVVRVSPRQGQTIIAKLPKANEDNFGSIITVILEKPNGVLKISAEKPDNVGGLDSVLFTVAGLVILESNGTDTWALINQIASNSPGAVGTTGPRGIDGTDGIDGQDSFVPGPQGVPGANGAAGVAGAAGSRGFDGFDGQDGDTLWLPAPAGQQGVPGTPGATGAQGIAGFGFQGDDGQDGDTLWLPAPATPGTPGATGATGAQGVAGVGFQGDAGQDGDTLMVGIQDLGPPKVPSTTSIITLAGITGNQGTVDITTLECGGCVAVSGPVGNWGIEGFTSTPVKPDGFWFVFSTPNGAFIGTLYEDDATAAVGDRLRNSHAQNGNGIGMQATIHKEASTLGGSPRWRVVGGGHSKLVGSDGVNPVNTVDVGQGGSDTIQITCGSASGPINVQAGNSALANMQGGTATVKSTNGDLTLSAVSGSNAIIGGNQVRIVSTTALTSAGFLSILEGAASTPTVAAGDGMYWVQNLTPNAPMFTDDNNADWPLGFASSANATSLTAVNSAVATTDVVNFSIPANEIRAGSAFRLEAHIRYDRGATATASTINFEAFLGATSLAFVSAVTLTAAGNSGNARIECTITFFGAPGAATPVTQSTVGFNSLTTVAPTVTLTNASVALTAATNAALAFGARVSFTAAVASLTFTRIHGSVRKITS